MEAFTLLKYWRGGGAAAAAGPGLLLTPPSSSSDTAATTSAVPQNENATESSDDDDDDDGGGGDDGPFFDLEFTVPDEADDDGQQNPNPEEGEEEEEEECDGSGEGEFKFTLSPSSNDRGASVSPSGDLFFKGKLVEVDPSSSSEPASNKPQFTASLLKSATKFRVFMSGLKKPKPDSAAPNPEPSKKEQPERVKFKVEEVPIVSLFTRDHSSRVNKPHPQSQQNETEDSEEKQRFSKEVVMHKYLKMVKPLYVRVSRRYGDKLAAAEGEAVAETAVGKGQKQGNLPARLRVVCKHLGKSRSASSAVAASPPAATVSSKRRDDSLLQQQDAIQGAILHCKRSFNASRGSESSQVPRSLHDASSELLSRKSTTEGKDKRL